MAQDIAEILPFEIWERCIAEACQGENYMANLLTLTMVSAKWSRFLMETPTLWATIHFNDGDEDSIATVAVFLQLSCEVELSLRIWAPLSETWKTVCPMLLHQNRRIREVTLQADSRSHLADCSFQSTLDDARLCGVLETIFKTLNYPASIRYIDVDMNRTVKMESIWVPENLVSMGNWIVPWSILKPPSTFPRLRYLSINAVDLARLLPHFSALGHLLHLYLHSDEQDYIQPPPPPASSVVAPLSLPSLYTLRYHGRFYQAPTQLLRDTSRTIQNLDLRVGILDLNLAVHSLEVCHSLRRLSLTLLMLEYDLDSRNRRRLYLLMSITSLMFKMKIPNWRLERVEDFKCEVKTFAGGQIPQKLNFDHLWHLFHAIFPNLEGLVWNVPIQPKVVASLIQQKRLRRFESHTVPALPYPVMSVPAHPTLESLHISDVRIFSGMFIENLLHFSVTFQEESRSFKGLAFGLLQSLNLKIGESVKKPWNLGPTNFPSLRVLSVAFLGPRNGFQLPDIPSLTEITISTLSPTYTQGMDFCASLACEPRKFPRLEQISLDSFLEWDILYLLLRRRNVLQKGSVSRIKKLLLPVMPPQLHSIFASLLAGINVLPFPFAWSMMTRLGIQGTQSRLLDPQIMGCFCCVQLGLAGCREPLPASRLPEEYRTPRMGNHNISDLVKSLGLFPIYDWDIKPPLIREDSVYEDIWMAKHQERAEEWRNTAYEWSKLHHRTLICHKRLCSPKIMVTEYDAENEDTRPDMPSRAILSLSNYDELLSNVTDLAKVELHDGILAAILSLIKLIVDEDFHVRSAAAHALAKLAAHAELHDAIRAAIPSLIELLEAVSDNTRSSAVSALVELAGHAELHDAIEPAIPPLIKLLGDEHDYVRSAATSALAKLMVHEELHDAIRAAIPSLIKLLGDEHYQVQTAAISALAKLMIYVKLYDAIEPAIPPLTKLLGDEHYQVQSAAISALAKLTVHAELCDAIGAAIPSLTRLLYDGHYSIRSAATSALAELGEHEELHDAIRAAIPSLIKLLGDEQYQVQSAAISALAKLTVHAELCDAIGAAIPPLTRLLYDGHSSIRSAATSALAELAEHAKEELHDAIQAAIPSLIKLLGDVHYQVQSAAISALAKLTVHAELRDAIEAAIPSLIELLEAVSDNTRSSAASALVKLAVHAELRDATKRAIPSLIRRLHDAGSYARSEAVAALAELAVHAELRDTVEPAIPSLIILLRDNDRYVQLEAAAALAELAVHAEFHAAIELAVPSLIRLLRDTEFYVRLEAASTLAKLLLHDELRVTVVTKYLTKAQAQFADELLVATPLLVELLKHNHSGDAATSALAELAAHTGFSDAIRPAIPSLIGQLQDPRNDVRFTATSMLATLARHNELCDVIRPAIPSLMELFEKGDSDIKLAAASALARLLPSAHSE